MKPLQLFFVPLLLTHFALAQQGQTYVPDDNFEQALIDLNIVSDPTIDDYVLTSEIQGITYLSVAFSNISDLTGIGDFAAMYGLDCSNNNLTTLDLSGNPALEILFCHDNNLTALNLAANPALEILACSDNNLTALDVSNNTALITLYCTTNNLTSLNVQNGNNENLNGLRATSNPYLECIQIDPGFTPGSSWYKDQGAVWSDTCYTYVPDDNFEQALIDLGIVSDPTMDDYVLTSEIQGITNLNIYDKNISDLTGIGDFANLGELIVSKNNLTSLDVSGNTALLILNCKENYNLAQLKLPVVSSTLKNLYCGNNNLADIDLGTSLDLEVLDCRSNKLNILDVTANTALESLNCSNNNLTILNTQNGNNAILNWFWATSNPDLECIQIDPGITPGSNWYKDQGAVWSDTCYTYVPDDNFEQALIDLGYDSILDDYVQTSKIDVIPTLNVHSKNISDLTGIEDFASLEELDCSGNNLSELDVSNNTALKKLFCPYNNLTALDVSNNTALLDLRCDNNNLAELDPSAITALTFLYCDNNNLTALDVSNNTDLVFFTCHSNNLTSLNVQNGNNEHLQNLNATSNPNLECIQIDPGFEPDPLYEWQKDPNANWRDDCLILGENQQNIMDIVLYPNPSKGSINITGLKEQSHIKISDLLGRAQLELDNYQEGYIDLNELPSGMYLVTIKSPNNGMLLRRLVVECE